MILARFNNNVHVTNAFIRTMATTRVESGKKAAAYHAVDLHIKVTHN